MRRLVRAGSRLSWILLSIGTRQKNGVSATIEAKG